MKGTNLGEFEEYVMLTVAILNDDAYGYAIQKEFENRTKRRVNLSSIHATLFRLEEKGFIKSKMGYEISRTNYNGFHKIRSHKTQYFTNDSS